MEGSDWSAQDHDTTLEPLFVSPERFENTYTEGESESSYEAEAVTTGADATIYHIYCIQGG